MYTEDQLKSFFSGMLNTLGLDPVPNSSTWGSMPLAVLFPTNPYFPNQAKNAAKEHGKKNGYGFGEKLFVLNDDSTLQDLYDWFKDEIA